MQKKIFKLWLTCGGYLNGVFPKLNFISAFYNDYMTLNIICLKVDNFYNYSSQMIQFFKIKKKHIQKGKNIMINYTLSVTAA